MTTSIVYHKCLCYYFSVLIEFSSLKKGSAEERVKQELQAVAEGVAASVLHSSARSVSPPMTQENGDTTPTNVEMQQNDRFEVYDASMKTF